MSIYNFLITAYTGYVDLISKTMVLKITTRGVASSQKNSKSHKKFKICLDKLSKYSKHVGHSQHSEHSQNPEYS